MLLFSASCHTGHHSKCQSECCTFLIFSLPHICTCPFCLTFYRSNHNTFVKVFLENGYIISNGKLDTTIVAYFNCSVNFCHLRGTLNIRDHARLRCILYQNGTQKPVAVAVSLHHLSKSSHQNNCSTYRQRPQCQHRDNRFAHRHHNLEEMHYGSHLP